MLILDKPAEKVNKVLLDLFTSRVRIKILNIFLSDVNEMHYVREVTRMVDEEVNAVRRELERLRSIGLLTTEKRANRLYYRVRTDFEFYYDLLRIVGKSTGLALKIKESREQLGNIKFVMFSARFVKNVPPSPNEIDMLVVGKVKIEYLQAIVREHEELIGHEVNYTVMTEEELSFRKKRNDAFIREVLSQPQVVIIGDEMELNA